MAAVVLATAGYDHKIRFWEASSRVCTRIVRHPDSQVNCLAIAHDKFYLAAGGNPHVRIFDVVNSSNSSPIAEFSHGGNVRAVMHGLGSLLLPVGDFRWIPARPELALLRVGRRNH